VTVGALNNPLLEIEPAVVDQVTPLDPLTVAENCCVPPDATVALVGEICTVIWEAEAMEMESFLSPTLPTLSCTEAVK
jgi:hypothetical protein